MNAASSMIWHEMRLQGDNAFKFDSQIAELEPFLADAWKAGVSARRPATRPTNGRSCSLIYAWKTTSSCLSRCCRVPAARWPAMTSSSRRRSYRWSPAAFSLDFKVKRVIAPLARALGPGGRMIAIQSHGQDPAAEIVQKVWPDDNPFMHDRHMILKAVKQELGPAGRELNFNVYADNRALFRYDMHTLPSEVEGSIGTSTAFAAWNAAVELSRRSEDEAPCDCAERCWR